MKNLAAKIFSVLFLYFAFESSQAVAYNWHSRTDCYGELRHKIEETVGWGRFKKTITIYLPPNPTTLSACYAVKVVTGAYENVVAKHGVYGNYCGRGWRDSRNGLWVAKPSDTSHFRYKPIDDVDEACRVHDQCYIRNGILNIYCDSRMMKEVCSLAVSAGGRSKRTETSAMLCTMWVGVFHPLAFKYAPVQYLIHTILR